MRYIDLIRAIKAVDDPLYLFPRSDAMEHKLNRLQDAGLIEHVWCGNAKEQKMGYRILKIERLAPKTPQIEVKAPMRVYIGDKARLRHPNGIAQLQHDVIGFNGDYVILEHPTLKHRLNRKVEWDSNVEGWVAA